MKEMEDRILKDGIIVNNDVIKVASFLNQQLDIALVDDFAADVAATFHGVTKVLTIEASGIALGYAVAKAYGGLPLVFAKKKPSVLSVDEMYTAKVVSFTHGNEYLATVDKAFVNKGDKILIVDDFLAAGGASLGLAEICEEAGAEIVGVAVAIEKNFQGGRKLLEKKGIKVYSAANILRFENNRPIFRS